MTFDWTTIQPTNGPGGVNTLSVSVIKGRTTPQVIPSTNRNYLVASDVIISGGKSKGYSEIIYTPSADLLNLRGKTLKLSIDAVCPNTAGMDYLGFALLLQCETSGKVQMWCTISSKVPINRRIAITAAIPDEPYTIEKLYGFIVGRPDYATIARPKIEVVGDDNGIWQPAPEDLWTQQKSFIATAPDGKAKAAFTVTYLGPNKQFDAVEFNPNQFY
jgi:hypothetical protein